MEQQRVSPEAPLAYLGVAHGLSGGVAGVCGALAGGPIADRWAQRDGAAHVLFPAICTLLAAPILTAAMFIPSLFGSISLLAASAGLIATACFWCARPQLERDTIG